MWQILLIFGIITATSCTVDHKIPPIKVEKIEIEHKVSPILVKMPWGAEFFKADPDCNIIDQITKADLSDFCSSLEKYKYNCCTVDFDISEKGCTMEFCVEKADPKLGCIRIIKGCI